MVASDPEFDVALLRVEAGPFSGRRPDARNKGDILPRVAELEDEVPEAGSGALLGGFSLGWTGAPGPQGRSSRSRNSAGE